MERLKNYIIRVLKRHHYWREIGYDELSELYISMMFRSFALSIIGIFIPLYLLNLGYPVIEIAMIFAWHFTFRIGGDYVAGRTIAAIGPKHTIFISYIIQIVMLGMFLTLPQFHWPLWLLGGVWGFSNSLFWLAYHVDFSKIKHTEHGGKEQGMITIVDRIGYTAGPVIGGVLATFFGPQFAFLVSTIILFLGLLPLMSTAEPVRTHRKLDFSPFTFKKIWPDFGTFAATCVNDLSSTFYWPLFMSLFVLGGFVYVELGLIATVGTLVSIGAARVIGQMTDRHHGRALFQTGQLGMSAIQLIRPFINTVRYALGLGVLYELLAVARNLPFFKGLYDDADQWPGHRTEFILLLELGASVIRAALCWMTVLFLEYMNVHLALSLPFLIAAAACGIGVLTERFRALD